jgi:hypothetical protein
VLEALPGHNRSFVILNAIWSYCAFIIYTYHLMDKLFAFIRERKPIRKVQHVKSWPAVMILTLGLTTQQDKDGSGTMKQR